jgi:hypothetical protein
MKISKIPGLGRFGIYIDDLDFNNITDEEWLEVGKLHLNSLVTIIRNVNLSKTKYMEQIGKWGSPRDTSSYYFTKKNRMTPVEALTLNADIGGVDGQWLKVLKPLLDTDDQGRLISVLKVTGKKNAYGEPIGLFPEGELLWHSNEAGSLLFTPGVALLGDTGMVGSSTGFMTTVDWYEKQSESFRNELDEMIVLHRFSPGKMTPGNVDEQDYIVNKNMCPVDDTRIPMIMRSPGGLKGLHFSVHTLHQVEGMSKIESDKLFERIKKELFVPEYTYDHWYQNDNDLCLFDNSITLHRRLGGVDNRLAHRIQYDYNHIQESNYNPYIQKEFQTVYKKQMRDCFKIMGRSSELSLKDRALAMLGL